MSIVSASLWAEADRLQRKGFTFTEIASAMKVARHIIVEVLYYDMPHVVRVAPPPERMDVAKRDTEILAAYDAGEKLRIIGEKYGITHERVRQVAIGAGRSPRRSTTKASGQSRPAHKGD